MNSKKDKYYRTSNLYLAAYLFASGMWLSSLDSSDPETCLFVFEDSPEREDLVMKFRYGKTALADARKYVYALEKLKLLLYEEKF